MRVVEYSGHSFIPELIAPGGIAIDCGANQGAFSQWLSANTEAQVHAFEPDPRLFPVLPRLPRVTYHNLAVTAENGSMTLNLGEERCSSLRYSEDGPQDTAVVATTSLESFCAAQRIPRVEFLKLDIEGAEIPVILSASPSFLSGIKQITVEFHDFIEGADRPQIEAAIRKLEDLGFYAVRFSHFTYGDMLFLNTRMVPVTWLDRLSIHLLAKYLPGVRRFLRRKLGPSHAGRPDGTPPGCGRTLSSG